MSESESDLEGASAGGSAGSSLDTTIGFNTEVGRETTVDSSSSSGAHGLFDPTLGSTDSSRPPLVPAQIAVRRLPEQQQRPGPSLLPTQAKEYEPALLLHVAAQQAGVPRGKPAAPVAPGTLAQAGDDGHPSAAPAESHLLLLLVQQQQQNAQMLALMQGMVAQLSTTLPAPPARAPTATAVVVRQPGAPARNPRAAPSKPPRSMPAGDCDKCRCHINNTCIQSN